ncbi:MAG: hypothetical protein AB7U63_19725 [Porticoccaceae bacterium]
MLIINTQTNQIIGATPDVNYTRANHILQAEPDGFDLSKAEEWVYNGTALIQDVAAALTRKKAEKITQIKSMVTEQIEALTWRIERAKERDALGASGETLNDVLTERESLRRAGNRIEAEINALSTIDEVNAVQFAVKPEDSITAARVTRLQFLQRFTDDEMNGFVTAAKTNAALEAYLMKLQNAEGVLLTDPSTIVGVQALEMMQIIGAGRAQEILTV